MKQTFVVTIQPRPMFAPSKHHPEMLLGVRSYVLVKDGRVLEAADTLSWMQGWTTHQLQAWVEAKGDRAKIEGPL